MRLTRKEAWEFYPSFIDAAAARELYEQMLAQPWRQTGEACFDCHFGVSYTNGRDGGGSIDGEIPEIPSFLQQVAEKVSAVTHVPVNYVQCHKFGPRQDVRPHYDPKGMVVPMLALGQERTFRVGDADGSKTGSPYNMPQARRPVANHHPQEEILLISGSLLVFDGPTVHSMFPADQDSKFNPNGCEWRITLLFRYTTECLRRNGTGRNNRTGETCDAKFYKDVNAPRSRSLSDQRNLFDSTATEAETKSSRCAETDWCSSEHWHEAAQIFPLMPDDELQKLADDIKQHGQKNPVILLNNRVLDGRNRVLACKMAGVRPEFQSRNAEKLGSPTAWVLSQNLHRRQLTATQRAFIAVEAEKLFAKEAKERQLAAQNNDSGRAVKANLPQQEKGQARDKAAERLNVSPRYVQEAKKILAESPETAAAAKAGKVSMAEAKKAIQPKDNPGMGICTLTVKNLDDTRCLSMADFRLQFVGAKVNLLLDACNDSRINQKSVHAVLKTYRRALQNFSDFCVQGIGYIDRKLKAAPPAPRKRKTGVSAPTLVCAPVIRTNASR